MTGPDPPPESPLPNPGRTPAEHDIRHPAWTRGCPQCDKRADDLEWWLDH